MQTHVNQPKNRFVQTEVKGASMLNLLAIIRRNIDREHQVLA